MEYINPIFRNSEITKLKTETPKKPKRTRAIRADKTKPVKFPVTPINQMKLKTYCKQAARKYEEQGKEPLSQTKFNNQLLRFGLKHPEILRWDLEYEDTKKYMHSNLLRTEYMEIGGPHGLAIQKNLSERKTVFMIIHSVLIWLKGEEGSIDKIL